MPNDVKHLRNLIADAKRLADKRRLATLSYLLSLAESEAASVLESNVEPTSSPVSAPPRQPRLFSPRRR